MPTRHHYCPSCWAELEANVRLCPKCAYDLAEYDKLPYEDKLILALNHPVRENRMIAAEVLGKLHSRKAVDAFAKLLEKESDYYLIRTIITAIMNINCEESKNLIKKLSQHPSALARKFVNEIVGFKKG